MWIRSQDKKQLVNANDLYIATRGKGYCISTGKGNDLGMYSSEEKAIKVLDMIEEKYLICYLTKGGLLATANFYAPPFGFIPPKVFQMPKDSEVE